MSVTRAFDLAQWVGAPVNVNDGVVVNALGPPFVSAFKPVVTSPGPGVVVSASVPAALAQNQILIAGPGPGFAWTLGVQTGGGGGIPEAPIDGQVYGRQSGSWTAVTSGGGGLADAPNDGTSYVRQNLAWTNILDGGTF